MVRVCACWVAVLTAAVSWLVGGYEADHNQNSTVQAEHVLSIQEIQALHRMMDRNKDGKLSLDEAHEYAHEIVREMANNETQTIIAELGTEEAGKLKLEEYLGIRSLHPDIVAGNEDLQREMEYETAKFQAADDNGDEFLHGTELTALFFPETHGGVLRLHTNEAMRIKDQNEDGLLTAREFWEADPTDTDINLTDDQNAEFQKLDHDGDGYLDISDLRYYESGEFHYVQAIETLFQISCRSRLKQISVQDLIDAHDAIKTSDAHNQLSRYVRHHGL